MSTHGVPTAQAKASPDPCVGLRLDGERVAVRALEEQSQRYPQHADIRYRLGLLRLARAEYDGARVEFEEALGIHPGYRAALWGLRLTGLLQGTVAPDALPATAEPTGAPDEALWKRADEAYQASRASTEGGDTIETLFDPEGAEPVFYHHYAAVFATRKGDLAAARRHWTASAALSDTSRSGLESHGVLPWTETSPEACACIAGWLWSPLAVDLYEFLGRIYARNGLIDEAKRCFTQAYLVLPREASHAMHLAELALADGEEERAIALLKQAVEAEPNRVEARIALGLECAAQGLAEEATVQFEAAAELAPGYVDVRYNLGLLHDAAERIEAAAVQFRKALQINPGFLPARQSLAALLCRTGHPEEGLLEYERVLRQGFQSADMLVKMGRAALELNRAEEALQFLERASFVNPEYAPSYFYLGQAYKAKGLRNKARAAWRKHLERQGDGALPRHELAEPRDVA